MCGTLCQARLHPALSPGRDQRPLPIGPKANTYRTKDQWYPAGYAYRLVAYNGLMVTLHC
jgi:hypothetical protein